MRTYFVLRVTTFAAVFHAFPEVSPVAGLADSTGSPIALDPTAPDHHGEAAALRARGPVTRVLLPGDVPFWAITHHEYLAEFLVNSRVSKNYQNWGAYQRGEIPETWPLWAMIRAENMFSADGLDHRRLRQPLVRTFTARRVEDLRPRIGQIVDGLLAGLPAHASPDGIVDLRPYFAYQVAVQVICELIGVPADWQPKLRDIVDTTFRSTVTLEERQQNDRNRNQLLQDLVELHRGEPGNDLTSALIGTQDSNPEALSDSELISQLWLLLGAGFETTLSLILNAVRALLTHPEQLKLAVSEERWGDVIEETMRWDAPIGNFTARFPLEDVEIGGVTLLKGDGVLACYSAAGRDAGHYGDAASAFDIRNATARHLSFGGGVHMCLGAPLARLEGTIALSGLFARYPKLELGVPAAKIPPVPSLFANSVAALPIRLGQPA